MQRSSSDTLPDVEVSTLNGTSTAHDEEFSEFFSATWPQLFRTALAISGDAGRAEDALQTAFAKAYSRWRAISRTEHPEAYVRRMVVNEVLGTFRRSWWRHETTAADPPEPPPAASSADDLLTGHALWAALVALPPRQRAVLVLRYYEDLSEAEIAETLGVSRGTVKSQASAALANLRTKGITR